MPSDDLSERLVASINASYGVHQGHRAAHAKGVLCAASFTPTTAATRLSRALHLRGGEVRAHVRFSNGSGDPNAPDTARDARGLAVKFYLADGTTTDVVAISLPAFFSRTPEDLLAFNDARRPDPETGVPDVERVGAYLAEHPEALPAVTAAMTHPHPASYAGLTYNSLHAFGFEGENGTHFGRYHFVPEHGDETLSDAEAAVQGPDYLSEELEKRLSRGSAIFHVRVELAAPDDSIGDPTAVWPEGREHVELGQLRVTRRAFDRERAGDVLVFDPTRITDGIQCPDDPILRARSGAYRVSVSRRVSAT
jgi:catalase